MLALSIRDLKKTYKNGVCALKGIDLDIQEGDFFALLGLNGAGKSTTIGIIGSLIKKTAGEVYIFNNDLDKFLRKAKKYIGLVPQEFNFNTLEIVHDIILNHAGYYGVPAKIARERAEYYLKKLGLWEKRLQCSRNLSGGMKRRLMIIRALIHHPRLLILDEPTAGVDIESRYLMWEFLKTLNKQSNTTIILTTHYLEEAEKLCQNVAVINHGEIIENTSMDKLLAGINSQILELHLDSPFYNTSTLNAYSPNVISNNVMEVKLNRGQNLTDLFSLLSNDGHKVLKLKEKNHALEELFTKLISDKRTN